MHHPIDWFHPDEQSGISREIEKKVDAVFYGHMHEFEQQINVNISQDISLKVQAGTLDTNNKNSGYSVIKLHSPNDFKYGKIIYRKYLTENRFYAPWTDRATDGCSDFSIDERSIFDSSKFSELSRIITNRIELNHVINTGKDEKDKKRISDIFIEPQFKNDLSANKLDQSIQYLNSLKDIEGAEGCVLISGTEQDGKTTLLKKIQINLLQNQVKSNFKRIVFYIDLKNEYQTHSKVLMGFISDYLNLDLQTSFEAKIKSAIKDGSAVFIVDNYDTQDHSSLSAIDKFISNNSNNSFILSCDSTNNAACITRLQHTYQNNKFHASIGTIARSDIRKIISMRPNLSTTSSEDEVFNNVVKIVNNSQLPHNHFVYSILLVIYENKNNLVGIISEADIIENYIEILLHKHCMTTLLNKPTYKVIIHILGFIASNMIYKRKTMLSEKDYFKIAIEFEELTFHKYNLNDYISPVIESGILSSNENNDIEFSNSCFLHYFAAYYMGIDDKLRDYVFSNDNYLILEKIVEYYSSQNSSSFDALSFLEEKIQYLKIEIEEEINSTHNIILDEMNLGEMSNISFLDIASSVEDVEKKIGEIKTDRNEYDEQLDDISPLENKKNTDSSIKNLESGNSKHDNNLDISLRYRKELSLFSKVFRNTELLMDPERVIEIFDTILKSYVFLIKMDMTRLDEDVVMPLLMPQIEENLAKANLKRQSKEKVISTVKVFLSVIRATIPNLIEHSMSNDLATKKPRFVNILKRTLSISNDSAEEMLLRFLLLEVERNNFKKNIDEISNCSDSFTSHTLFLKLIQMLYERHDFSPQDLDFIKGKVTQLVKRNKGAEAEKFKQFARMLNPGNNPYLNK